MPLVFLISQGTFWNTSRNPAYILWEIGVIVDNGRLDVDLLPYSNCFIRVSLHTRSFAHPPPLAPLPLLTSPSTSCQCTLTVVLPVLNGLLGLSIPFCHARSSTFLSFSVEYNNWRAPILKRINALWCSKPTICEGHYTPSSAQL